MVAFIWKKKSKGWKGGEKFKGINNQLNSRNPVKKRKDCVDKKDISASYTNVNVMMMRNRSLSPISPTWISISTSIKGSIRCTEITKIQHTTTQIYLQINIVHIEQKVILQKHINPVSQRVRLTSLAERKTSADRWRKKGQSDFWRQEKLRAWVDGMGWGEEKEDSRLHI